MRSLLVLMLCLLAVSANPRISQRIVGGTVTTIEEHPEMAALLFSDTGSNHRQACGGIIINNRSILTAAHCTIRQANERWRTRLGSTNGNSGGRIFNTRQVVNHPQYHPRTRENDIAVLRVQGEIPTTSRIRPATLGTYHIGDDEVVWAAGWGRTRFNGPISVQLRHVQIWTVNQEVCNCNYRDIGRRITDNMVCAGWLDVGGRDSCQGDYGGPLYHHGVVVGVLSWGNGCGNPRFPGVSIRVAPFVEWIDEHK